MIPQHPIIIEIHTDTCAALLQASMRKNHHLEMDSMQKKTHTNDRVNNHFKIGRNHFVYQQTSLHFIFLRKVYLQSFEFNDRAVSNFCEKLKQP